MNTRLLLVPYDSGQRGVRMGAGPEHLCAQGLPDRLTVQGHQVEAQTIEAGALNSRRESLVALLRTIVRILPVQALTLASYDPSYDQNGAVCATAFEAAETVLAGLK